MEPIDVSIHGWPIGPVPLAVGIYSLFVFFNILRGKTPLSSDNTISPLGFGPLIVAIAAIFFGVQKREDLSGSIEIWAGLAGIVIGFVLTAIMHHKVGVPIWGKWIKLNSLSTREVLVRFLYASIAMSVLFIQSLFFGTSYLQSTKCDANFCEAVAVAVGSNLSASGLLWLTTIIFSFFGLGWLLLSRELFHRLFLALLHHKLGD